MVMQTQIARVAIHRGEDNDKPSVTGVPVKPDVDDGAICRYASIRLLSLVMYDRRFLVRRVIDRPRRIAFNATIFNHGGITLSVARHAFRH